MGPEGDDKGDDCNCTEASWSVPSLMGNDNYSPKFGSTDLGPAGFPECWRVQVGWMVA